MGVQSLTRLLEEEGLLPSKSTCDLWNTELFSFVGNHNLDADQQDIVRIVPPRSTLAVDGNGLAFHLYKVAHARYYETLLQQRRHETAQVLPHWMPMDQLQLVTHEFFDRLLHFHRVQIVLYFDGPRRRLKCNTDEERQSQRDQTWDHLKQYCHNGALPAKRRHSKQENMSHLFFSKFPLSTLFMDQFRHDIDHYQRQSLLQVVYCEEEADSAVALLSASDPTGHTFAVGKDSDFFIFGHTRDTRSPVRYIPLDCINGQGPVLSAVVLQRNVICQQLNLPDEESIIELSLLMGNDFTKHYMHHPKSRGTIQYKGSLDTSLIVEHMRDMGPGYRITSTCTEMEQAFQFSRALFTFQTISDFPMDNGVSASKTHNLHSSPQLPLNFDLQLAKTKPSDFSIEDAILRPIQAFIESRGDTVTPNEVILTNSREPSISEDHLEAFQIIIRMRTENSESAAASHAQPNWNDVLVAHIFEKCVSKTIRSWTAIHPSFFLNPPWKLFNHAQFHMTLTKIRTSRVVPSQNTTSPVTVSSDNLPSPPVQQNETTDLPREILPIDEHEDSILDTVKRQRVTIIRGDTGCGKSSRVPIMLLRAPPPEVGQKCVKMFISQPRRIAAKSLAERVRSCEPDLRNKIALRMGHGVREYETKETKAWFVTTGYLVKLLANNPQTFDSHTHLIIDEVHERSVDTDILCLLCKRLLVSHPNIRLILMSATLAATIYQDYFDVRFPPIHVGAKRFPIEEFFVEDLEHHIHLPPKQLEAANVINQFCEKNHCNATPPSHLVEKMHGLAVQIALSVGSNGSSVLIFVPGMADIVSITDLVEKVEVHGIAFTCFPIHGDIPFEDQLQAFEPAEPGQVKLIIATNSAESSITLPDVDHVICLGLCKQITYNATSHRQILLPTWISKASAIQRAGRTGRVRPGTVYRLYSRKTYEHYMDSFEPGEMSRIPLDSVILNLADMLKEKEVIPILMDCLEPPDISNIDRSFHSLFDSNFITGPCDGSEITKLGSLVVALGIDLTLGSLVGLGIQFGVAAEAIQIAGILSFPKTPWVMTNPMFHDPETFNDITAKTFTSKVHFDANLYSEPLSIMNLIWDYTESKHKSAFCNQYCVSYPRINRLIATIKSLHSRVSEFLAIPAEKLRVNAPPVCMSHGKITILRILQVWVFSDGIIESKCLPENDPVLELRGDEITESHLEQVLDLERHPFKLTSPREIQQNGSFVLIQDEPFDFSTYSCDFESRFVSFMLESKFRFTYFAHQTELCLFLCEDDLGSKLCDTIREVLQHECVIDRLAFKNATSNNKRGRNGRSCGLWSSEKPEERGEGEQLEQIVRFSLSLNEKMINRTLKIIGRWLDAIQNLGKTMSCVFGNSSPNRNSSISFRLKCEGECLALSRQDVVDLFSTPNVTFQTTTSKRSSQVITFEATNSGPLSSGRKANEVQPSNVILDAREMKSIDRYESSTSWHRPVISDVPEGKRLLSVLASSRRHNHSIRFKMEDGHDSVQDGPKYVEVQPQGEETRIGKRWKRLGTALSVFPAENSVTASAIAITPTKGYNAIYACCANTLEVSGGSIRVEGITLLPPSENGRLFLLLSFLTFGLRPYNGTLGIEDWLREGTDESIDAPPTKHGGSVIDSEDKKLSEGERIKLAIAFHESCRSLGEELTYYPSHLRALCTIFDDIDGFPIVPWISLDHDMVDLTQENEEAVTSIKYDSNESSCLATSENYTLGWGGTGRSQMKP